MRGLTQKRFKDEGKKKKEIAQKKRSEEAWGLRVQMKGMLASSCIPQSFWLERGKEKGKAQERRGKSVGIDPEGEGRRLRAFGERRLASGGNSNYKILEAG